MNDSTDGGPYGTADRQRKPSKALQRCPADDPRSNPLALRRIAAKLIERAEEGELAAIREIADRLDGKPAQMLDRRDVPITELTRAELLAIASGARVVDGDDDVSLLSPAQQPESQRR